MKTKIIAVLLLCMQVVMSQEITGSWKGELDIQGMKIPLILHLTNEAGKLVSTVDSPKQGAKDIPVTKISYLAQQLDFEIASLGVNYSGKYVNDTFEGVFKQGNMELPLVLSRLNTHEMTEVLKRPQTPKGPFDYATEDVNFVNPVDKNTLAGTLSIPKNFNKKSPVLVMITGSGKQNRDSELFGHKPFAVIADDFAKKGIATLRLDDRGIDGSSKGSKEDTSFNFATDINAAVEFLKEKGYQNIGLIGHSEGGMIAPIVANMNQNVKFLVLMAGPGTPINELLAQQNYLASKLAGMSEAELQKGMQSNQKIYTFIKTYRGKNYDDDLEQFLKNSGEDPGEDAKRQLKNAWFRYFIAFDPEVYLSKIKIPVLAINGSLDFQVPSKANLEGIKKSLTKAKNKEVETYEFEGMNHLFQECKTGAFSEYADLEQTISPKVLEKVSTWVLKQK